jgi:hypothetical protein
MAGLSVGGPGDAADGEDDLPRAPVIHEKVELSLELAWLTRFQYAFQLARARWQFL